MPQFRSYLSLVEKRIAAWSRLCERPTLEMLDAVVGSVIGERKEEIWNVATHIHFHVKSVRQFLHALGELAIEERASFRSFATIPSLRAGLAKYGYVELSQLPIANDVLLFLYFAIRDGASFLKERDAIELRCLSMDDRVADDYY